MEIRNHGADGAKRALEAFQATRDQVQQATQSRVQEARAQLEHIARRSAQGEDSIEITRPKDLRAANQAHQAHQAERPHHQGGDSVELSHRGRALAGEEGQRAAALRLEQAELREARIASLRAELEGGNFHNPERLHRAAESMLRGHMEHEGHANHEG